MCAFFLKMYFLLRQGRVKGRMDIGSHSSGVVQRRAERASWRLEGNAASQLSPGRARPLPSGHLFDAPADVIAAVFQDFGKTGAISFD